MAARLVWWLPFAAPCALCFACWACGAVARRLRSKRRATWRSVERATLKRYGAPRMDGRDSLARFRAEAEALASKRWL